MADSGKNKPCPCGSMIPYEKCCGKEEGIVPSGWVPRVIDGGLKDDHHSLSIDQLNSVLKSVMKAENVNPREDFCGLSPTDMSALFYHPFDSPDIVQFCTDIHEVPESPFMELFIKLLHACDRQGLKLTATGNLPRNFCRDTARAYFADKTLDDTSINRFISSEPGFEELYTVNLISKMAGYTRKYKGKLLLTKKGEQLVKKGVTGNDFYTIFKKYAYEFNWAYRDGYAELRIIQTSFLFTLYILKKYGDIYREPAFYEGLFIKAFPMSLKEVSESTYSSPEQNVSRCYSLRSFERFAWFFGFAEFNVSERKFFLKGYELKKTPFLDDFITFHK